MEIKKVIHSPPAKDLRRLANYLDPIVKQLAEEMNEILDYLRNRTPK
jgi:hypothetical protein